MPPLCSSILRADKPFANSPELLTTACSLVLSCLSTIAQKNYGTGQRHYLKFARLQSLRVSDVFPPTPAMLLGFVAYLFNISVPKPINHKTAKSYLAHVKHLSSIIGMPNAAFFCPRLRLALKTFRKRRPGARAQKRLPITIHLLAAFAATLDLTSDHHHIVTFAALAVGVYGLFRSGELATKFINGKACDNTPCRADVVWAADHVVIHLRSSKTDPFREGVDIPLYANGTLTCPFAALKRAWDVAPDQSPDAPLFQHPDSSPLLYTQLNQAIKCLATTVGLDPQLFAGHSLRIGGATSLAMLGYPDYIIKIIGRWTSVAYQAYTRLTGNTRATAAKAFGLAAAQSPVSYFGGVDPKSVCAMDFDEINAALHR